MTQPSAPECQANVTSQSARPVDAIGPYEGTIEARLSALDSMNVIPRMWRVDHTVWRSDPTEISDRLGWLTVPQRMRREMPGLQVCAQEVRNAGYRHVVLLGMGGSSLGPDVLRAVFGPAEGYPQLIVLDSTVSEAVRSVSDAIHAGRTLFLVSSKSGSTIEPNCLYAHFRGMVEHQKGQNAGENFIAITDPGTVLERLSREAGFRRAFLNPADIGGRYSVLSYFGLVPAALIGIDIEKLLDRAEAMLESCGPNGSASMNPGARLGATIAQLALQGRDKLTLITSPGIASFGLWVEQLLAESTGKQGTGIIPVANEPMLSLNTYGDDRQFVYLQLAGNDNAETDDFAHTIAASAHPLACIHLQDRFDLAGEFYRWEFATAVAGALLSIHPFDQPDVQSAKDMTDAMLAQLERTSKLPTVEAAGSWEQLLARIPRGGYLAVLAYCGQTREIDASLSSLRRHIAEGYGVATTVGYGPRYLHSTGQLHKGGTPSGAYLLLTADDDKDVPIPGRSYSFGQLAHAQALGDLRALEAAGRPVMWVHARDVAGAIGDLNTRIAARAQPQR